MTEQCGHIRFETNLFRVNVRVNVSVKKMTEKSIFAFTFTLTLSFVAEGRVELPALGL